MAYLTIEDYPTVVDKERREMAAPTSHSHTAQIFGSAQSLFLSLERESV